MSEIVYEKIIVDNTAPLITFTNNGSSDWIRNAKTYINVEDTKSGGDSSTYKYIFSYDKNAKPDTKFNLDTEVNYEIGNGKLYIIAEACDIVGNCGGSTSDFFNMDTKGPSIPEITLTFEDDSTVYNQSWTNRNIITTPSSTDEGAGGIYYEYSHDKVNYDNFKSSNSSWLVNGGPAWRIHWEGSWDFYVRACDSLGNCSEPAPKYWIGIDKTAPAAPNVTLVKGNWTEVENDTWYNFDIHVSGKANANDPTPTSTDDRSQIKKYQISDDNSNWHDWSYDSSSLMYTINTDNIHYRYIRAVDNAGNVSNVTTKTIKRDTLKPTIDNVFIYKKGEYSTHPNQEVVVFNFVEKGSKEIIGFRSHCGSTNVGETNMCSWYNAIQRLNTFLKDGKVYENGGIKDQKTIKFSVSGLDNNIPMATTIGTEVRYAFVFCDIAGNCNEWAHTINFGSKTYSGYSTGITPDYSRINELYIYYSAN